jgi:uncharacterized membrane protein YbhN (UPF0104 family)
VSWQIMLAPAYPVSVWRLFRYSVTAFAASVVTPVRAGEVLRVWVLKARHNVPVTRSIAVAVAEKVLDGAAMLILVAPLPWLVPDLPAWVARAIGVMSSLGLAVAVVVWALRRWLHPTGWSRRAFAAMSVLKQPRGRLTAALAVLLLAWIMDIGMVWLVQYGVGIQLPWAAGLLILLTLNLAIAVPSTPGSVGVLELGAIAALRILDVPSEQALAFALLYHGIQVIPLLLAGLFDIRFVLRLQQEAGRHPPVRATEARA